MYTSHGVTRAEGVLLQHAWLLILRLDIVDFLPILVISSEEVFFLESASAKVTFVEVTNHIAITLVAPEHVKDGASPG